MTTRKQYFVIWSRNDSNGWAGDYLASQLQNDFKDSFKFCREFEDEKGACEFAEELAVRGVKAHLATVYKVCSAKVEWDRLA